MGRGYWNVSRVPEIPALAAIWSPSQKGGSAAGSGWRIRGGARNWRESGCSVRSVRTNSGAEGQRRPGAIHQHMPDSADVGSYIVYYGAFLQMKPPTSPAWSNSACRCIRRYTRLAKPIFNVSSLMRPLNISLYFILRANCLPATLRPPVCKNTWCMPLRWACVSK